MVRLSSSAPHPSLSLRVGAAWDWADSNYGGVTVHAVHTPPIVSECVRVCVEYIERKCVVGNML